MSKFACEKHLKINFVFAVSKNRRVALIVFSVAPVKRPVCACRDQNPSASQRECESCKRATCERPGSPPPSHGSLSPPAGSCPASRPYCSRRCRRSQRSTSGCPWRTRSCCGSCTTATWWRAPAASRPPPPSARRGTPPPSPQLRRYRPDNPPPPLRSPLPSRSGAAGHEAIADLYIFK